MSSIDSHDIYVSAEAGGGGGGGTTASSTNVDLGSDVGIEVDASSSLGGASSGPPPEGAPIVSSRGAAAPPPEGAPPHAAASSTAMSPSVSTRNNTTKPWYKKPPVLFALTVCLIAAITLALVLTLGLNKDGTNGGDSNADASARGFGDEATDDSLLPSEMPSSSPIIIEMQQPTSNPSSAAIPSTTEPITSTSPSLSPSTDSPTTAPSTVPTSSNPTSVPTITISSLEPSFIVTSQTPSSDLSSLTPTQSPKQGLGGGGNDDNFLTSSPTYYKPRTTTLSPSIYDGEYGIECTTNDECQLMSNYCDGCNCDSVPIQKNFTPKVCTGEEYFCFVEPCSMERQIPICYRGYCKKGDEPVPTSSPTSSFMPSISSHPTTSYEPSDVPSISSSGVPTVSPSLGVLPTVAPTTSWIPSSVPTVNSSSASDETEIDLPIDPVPSRRSRSFLINNDALLPYTIPVYNEESLSGYSDCIDLETNITQAMYYLASMIIERNAQYQVYVCRDDKGVGGAPPGVDFAGPTFTTQTDDTATAAAADTAETENSYDTNTREENVDEVDIVKSDGKYVYAAYGDTLVIWDAKLGKEVTRIVMPKSLNDDVDDVDGEIEILVPPPAAEEKPVLAKEGKEEEEEEGGTDEEGGGTDEGSIFNEDVIPLVPPEISLSSSSTSPGNDNDRRQRQRRTKNKNNLRNADAANQNEYHRRGRQQNKRRKDLSIIGPIQTGPRIRGLLLDKASSKLVVLVTGYGHQQSPYFYGGCSQDLNATRILNNFGSTHLRIYDTSNLSSNNELTLLATKNLQGTYQSGRSIDEMAYVVTMSGLNTHCHFDSHLVRYNKEFCDMNSTDYKAAAKTKAMEIVIPAFVDRLMRELNLGKEDCGKMVQVSVFQTGKDDDNDGNNNETDTEDVLPAFSSGGILRGLAQVHSFNITDEAHDQSSDDKVAEVQTSVSGCFLPTQWTETYASESLLVLAARGYHFRSESSSYREYTYLVGFHIQSDDGSVRAAVAGQVSGYLLNSFSIDHEDDYLRIATTNNAQWGRVQVMDVDSGTSVWRWQQMSDTTNQVVILALPDLDSSSSDVNTNNDDDDDVAIMEEVGSINATAGLGKKNERIYSVRFVGEVAYVVTFLQTDPFYTLNLTDPTNPFIAGELNVTGFSNYLHPIDDHTVLAIGQEANADTGRPIGLQISLFDVMDLSKPALLQRYTVEDDDKVTSSSSAQYDHRAFRYLPLNQALILPTSIRNNIQPELSFDGFIIYDISRTSEIAPRFNISHVDSSQTGLGWCWYWARLDERSMVFNGKVMTMKGHTVLNHDLSDGEELWELNLDETLDEKATCYNYWGF